MAELKLSVCIAVVDPSQDLSACLSSCAAIADEIVILDRHGEARAPDSENIPTRVVQVPATGSLAASQICAQAATGDWTLLLDADEMLSEALALKIRRFKEQGHLDEFRGFRVRRRRWVYGHRMVSMGLGPDYPERLMRRVALPYAAKPRPLGRLEEPIEHRVVRSIDLWLRRRRHAVEHASEEQIGPWRMAFVGPFTFAWEFFLRGGWRDGRAGLTWAGLRATEKFLMAMRSWQRRLPEAGDL